MQSPSYERRQSFRIQHDLIFNYKPIDAHTAEHSEPESAVDRSASVQLLSELRRIDTELAYTAKALKDQHRLLADYLQKLSNKVDLIARHSIFAGAPDKQHAERISISEGGVAFLCERALYKGNFLVLQIIFLPGYTPVIVFAQVSRCDAEADKYRVAAEFHRLRESDRQELAKQMLKAQASQRKRLLTPEKKL